METKLSVAAWRRTDSRLSPILFCFLVSAAAFIPFFFIAEKPAGAGPFSLRMPITHDLYLHIDQMRSFYEGVSAGEIYPRWERDVNRGFGAPTFGYYPPGVYYLTSLFFAAGLDAGGAMLGAVFLMAAASAIAFYAYARRAFSRRAAMAAMIAYVFWPYHLVDLYQRGALAEMTAFVWMPLIMYFGDRLIDTGEAGGSGPRGTRMAAGLGVTYGGFLWSHPPTAYQFTIIFGIYILTQCALTKRFRAVPRVAAGIVLGIALGSAYLLPAVADQGLVRGDFIQTQFPYHLGYVFGDPMRYGESAAEFMREIDSLWCLGAAVIIVGAATFWLKYRRKGASWERASRVVSWVVAGAAASYLMTSPSHVVSEALPGIEVGVFPWRLLSVTTLVASLVVGELLDGDGRSGRTRTPGDHDSSVAESEETKRERLPVKTCFGESGFRRRVLRLLSPIAAMAIGMTASLFGMSVVLAYCGSPAFSPQVEHLNFAMLPRSAYGDLEALPRVERSVLAGGKGTVEVKSWAPSQRTLRVRTLEPDKLLIRTFNFPGWSATVDGKKVDIVEGRLVEGRASAAGLIGSSRRDSPDAPDHQRPDALGDIGVLLPAGDHLVTLEFRSTLIQRVGASLTLLSSVATMILVVAPFQIARRRAR